MELVQKEAFKPIIKVFQSHDNYILNTQFYLGFNGKKKLLEPIIEFYQKILDYFDRNYARY